MGKLFGTDGICGIANRCPMDSETALKAGRAVAAFCESTVVVNPIVVGKDTRISGERNSVLFRFWLPDQVRHDAWLVLILNARSVNPGHDSGPACRKKRNSICI